MEQRTSQAIPAGAIHQFWAEVEEHLRSRHALGGEQGVRSILRYRNEIDRVGPLVYHREPADVADDIVTGGYTHAERMVG